MTDSFSFWNVTWFTSIHIVLHFMVATLNYLCVLLEKKKLPFILLIKSNIVMGPGRSLCRWGVAEVTCWNDLRAFCALWPSSRALTAAPVTSVPWRWKCAPNFDFPTRLSSVFRYPFLKNNSQKKKKWKIEKENQNKTVGECCAERAIRSTVKNITSHLE